MAEDWKRWTGQTVAEELLLKDYVGGSEYSAAFRAEWRGRSPQTVAIKLVRNDSPEAEIQAKSWQRATKTFHPNLIRLFRTGVCQFGGATYLYGVMEYAEENLAQVISERALTEPEARDMLAPAASALAYLHGKGMVHGRVTPANILAIGDRLKLSTDTLERADEPIRHPSPYDPPEKTTSPAADMWSLGMTLVEALTRRMPAWDPATRSEAALPASLSGVLLDVAGNCLRRNPKQRWTAANVLQRLVPQIGLQQPQRSSPVNVLQRLVPQVKLQAPQGSAPALVRKMMLTAIVVVVVLLGVAGVRLFIHSSPDRGETSLAAVEASLTKPAQSQEAANAVPRVTPAIPPATLKEPSRTAENSSNSPASSAIATANPPAAAKTLEPISADLSAIPGESSSGIVHKVLPDAPEKALDTIYGTVRVEIKVSVDNSGNNSDATITSPGPSTYFANLALNAARQWKFAPGRGTPADWTIRFEFTRSGAEAFARRAGSK